MKIRIGYTEILTAMQLQYKVLQGKKLAEEAKVSTFYVDGGVLGVISTDTCITCKESLDEVLEIGTEEGEKVTVYTKELLDILLTYKGLSQTEVVEVELESYLNRVKLVVKEKDKTTEEIIENRVYIHKLGTPEYIQKEIREVEDEWKEGVPLSMEEVLGQLQYVYPSMQKAKKTSALTHVDGFGYVVLDHIIGIKINNEFSELEGVSIGQGEMSVLREILKEEGEVEVSRDMVEREGVHIGDKIRWGVGKVRVLMKLGSEMGLLEREGFTPRGEVGVRVSKGYMMDILKRVSMYGRVYVEVDIEGGTGEMRVVTSVSEMRVPVKGVVGRGRIRFVISTEHLSTMVLPHIKKGDAVDELWMYFTESLHAVEITVADGGGKWETKYPRAPKEELTRV